MDNFLILWSHFISVVKDTATPTEVLEQKKKVFFDDFKQGLMNEVKDLKHFEKIPVFYRLLRETEIFEIKYQNGTPLLANYGSEVAQFLYDEINVFLHAKDIEDIELLLSKLYELEINSKLEKICDVEIGRKFVREASILCYKNGLVSPFLQVKPLGMKRFG